MNSGWLVTRVTHTDGDVEFAAMVKLEIRATEIAA